MVKNTRLFVHRFRSGLGTLVIVILLWMVPSLLTQEKPFLLVVFLGLYEQVHTAALGMLDVQPGLGSTGGSEPGSEGISSVVTVGDMSWPDVVLLEKQPSLERPLVLLCALVELAMIMDRLYGGVCYAGIDTDPELKYPKGAGRVAFSNQQSYIAAISARFVQLQHGEIDKRVRPAPLCSWAPPGTPSPPHRVSLGMLHQMNPVFSASQMQHAVKWSGRELVVLARGR